MSYMGMNINIGSINIGILDVICVAVIAIAGIIGYKRGFARSALGLLSFITSIVAAYILKSLVYDILMGTSLSNSVYGNVFAAIADNTPSFSEAPNAIQGIVSEAATEGIAAVSAAVSGAIVSLVSFLIVFVLVRFLVKAASQILLGVVRLPIIGAADKILGFVTSVLKWTALIYVACAVAVILVIPKPNSTLGDAVRSSVVCGYIKNSDLVNGLIGRYE